MEVRNISRRLVLRKALGESLVLYIVIQMQDEKLFTDVTVDGLLDST